MTIDNWQLTINCYLNVISIKKYVFSIQASQLFDTGIYLISYYRIKRLTRVKKNKTQFGQKHVHKFFFYPSELVPHSLHVWIYCLYSLLSLYRYINEIWITMKTIKTKIIENLNCWPELKRQKKVKIMKVNQFWKILTNIFIGRTIRMFTRFAGGYFACSYFLKKIQLCKSCNIYYKDCMGYHLRV